MSNEHQFLNTKQAAAFLGGLSPAWLEALRVKGGGPMYLKLGRRVVYRTQDLETWAEANRRSNTAEIQAKYHSASKVG